MIDEYTLNKGFIFNPTHRPSNSSKANPSNLLSRPDSILLRVWKSTNKDGAQKQPEMSLPHMNCARMHENKM